MSEYLYSVRLGPLTVRDWEQNSDVFQQDTSAAYNAEQSVTRLVLMSRFHIHWEINCEQLFESACSQHSVCVVASE
jgi:hypothetical protein